jgi:predicted transcriptional regulator
MSTAGGFHDFLFEVSNEIRYAILVSLRDKAKRITDITREMDLKTPEARRHVSRLSEVGLIQRNVEGFYSITPYGEGMLILLREFDFMTRHRDYFQSHKLTTIPGAFLKRISELSESTETDNAMDFLRQTENLLKEAAEYVWLLADQFPMNSLTSIVEAIERGVQFRIIEPRERILNPDIESMTSEEIQALGRTRQTPLVEQRMVDDVNVSLFLSENRCVIAFPTPEGQYDYTGFTASDGSSLNWCRGLFRHYWDEAENREPATPSVQVRRGPVAEIGGSLRQVVVVGRERPDVDAQAVQDAVDNYDEVILKGFFNLGTSTININRSVVLRGEGRENDVPSTKVYKKGWTFPFFVEDHSILLVRGEGIDVIIENIHFMDFNFNCINLRFGNSVKIVNNRITLPTGLGREITYGSRGDHVIGIVSGGSFNRNRFFTNGVLIEGNYLDFATSYSQGGFLSRKGLEDDPIYRPNLENHENYCSTGIHITFNVGGVIVRDNVVLNMNTRGILVNDNYETAEIRVISNTIYSEVYGSYPYSSHMAGVGIFAQSTWINPANSGARVEITDNEIRCDKLNYCGIAVYGQSRYGEGAGKLGECIVRDNHIHLDDGSVGMVIRKNDHTEVTGNKITGNAYYGFHLWGSKDREGFDLGSNENLIEDNDMKELSIKPPDEYSDNHVDGRMFTGSEGKATTGHVWLNQHTSRNKIHVKTDESVIDEGQKNTIKQR